MIKSDLDKQLKALEAELGALYKRSVPYGVAQGLNDTAFQARSAWQREAESKLTLRNKFTTRSMFVEKAKVGAPWGAMESKVGSTAPYAANLETGETQRKQGKHGVPVPTTVATGEGRGTGPQKRLVRRPNQIANINLGQRVRGSRGQRNAGSIAMARAAGQRHVLIETKRGHGIAQVPRSTNGRLDLLWDLSKPSVRISAHPTLEPATAKATRYMPATMVKAIEKQIEKQKAFRAKKL